MKNQNNVLACTWIVLLLAIMFLAFSSCVRTPEGAERKITRLTKRFPSIVRYDTITVTDTITIKGDTVTRHFYFMGDTVRINEGRLEMKYFYNQTTNEHYLHGQCKDTTVVNKVTVAYPWIKKKTTDWLPWIVAGVLAVLLFWRKYNS